MQAVDEKMETIHLYVVREEAPKPSLLPIFMSVIALSVLVAFCALTPYQQPVTRMTLRVPAVLLPLRTFTVSVPVIPTGVKTYSATTAHGTLTITNGSIIGQVIPASFAIHNVATDRAVYVPAGNANGYGYAVVPAHALTAGNGGNFVRLTINQVIGSSVYIRNLNAFHGGRDAYSIKYVIAQDKQSALIKARGLVALKVTGLHYPCREYLLQSTFVNTVTWRCQFVTFRIPSYMHVSAVHLIGKNLIVSVWFITPVERIWMK